MRVILISRKGRDGQRESDTRHRLEPHQRSHRHCSCTACARERRQTGDVGLEMQRRQRRRSGFMSAAAVALARNDPITAANTWRERCRALSNTLQAFGPIPRVHGEGCCLTQDDGSVKCWGVNNFGQLGYGDTRQRGDGSNGGHRACDGLALVMLGGCCFGDGGSDRMLKEACVGPQRWGRTFLRSPWERADRLSRSTQATFTFVCCW